MLVKIEATGICGSDMHAYHGLVVSETKSLRRESLVTHAGCRVHDPINDPALENDTFDLVVDAVGGGVTRISAMAAVSPGGILVHIGLMDAKEVFDIRKLTLFEIKLLGVYCYTPAGCTGGCTSHR